MPNKRTKQIILQGVGPEIVSTLVGVIIGIVTYRVDTAATRSLGENLVDWILSINAGAVAHQISWVLMIKLGIQKPRDGATSLKSIWKPTALGMVLTFLFIFLMNSGWTLSSGIIVMMFLQVIAICIVVHIFLFQFKFYSLFERLKLANGDLEMPFKEESGELQSDTTIELTIDERIEKVKLDQVSHIRVEDHYCTIVFFKENTWHQWTVYGKLKTYEQKYAPRLIRINRSVLVNPKMVIRVEKISGKHLVTLKGAPETPYTLSSSQKHFLDRLIPVVR